MKLMRRMYMYNHTRSVRKMVAKKGPKIACCAMGPHSWADEWETRSLQDTPSRSNAPDQLKKHHIRLGDLLALIPVFLGDEACAFPLRDLWNRIMEFQLSGRLNPPGRSSSRVTTKPFIRTPPATMASITQKFKLAQRDKPNAT